MTRRRGMVSCAREAAASAEASRADRDPPQEELPDFSGMTTFRTLYVLVFVGHA